MAVKRWRFQKSVIGLVRGVLKRGATMRKVRVGFTVMVGCVGLMWAGVVVAHDPVVKCQADKAKAAGMRAQCLTKGQAEKLKGKSFDAQMCEDKFDKAIDKADKKAAKKGAACRFVDNGDETVSDLDNLTMWEKKTDDGSVHDKDKTYTWNTTFGGTTPNGTAFTDFLGELNNCVAGSLGGPITGGFANYCDWRLASKDELRSIVDCSFGSPCIDPIFGPTAASFYWSSTSSASGPVNAWFVNFLFGFGGNVNKVNFSRARAVRGGR